MPYTLQKSVNNQSGHLRQTKMQVTDFFTMVMLRHIKFKLFEQGARLFWKQQPQTMVEVLVMSDWYDTYQAHASSDWAPTQLNPEDEQKFRSWIAGTKWFADVADDVVFEDMVVP